MAARGEVGTMQQRPSLLPVMLRAAKQFAVWRPVSMWRAPGVRSGLLGGRWQFKHLARLPGSLGPPPSRNDSGDGRPGERRQLADVAQGRPRVAATVAATWRAGAVA